MSRGFILVLCVLVVGCAPASSRYYYLNLVDTPDARTLEYGKPQIENLLGSSTIPLAYQIDRNGYSLKFEVAKDSPLPVMLVSVRDKSNDLSLRPRQEIVSRSPKGWRCSNFYPLSNDRVYGNWSDDDWKGGLRFYWLETCNTEHTPMYISFDVLDEQGKVLSNEDIPFKLKSNGRYFYIDAI